MYNNDENRTKKYDLEDRTLEFSKRVITLVKNTKQDLANIEICKQLVRSSTSVGANYIEANESLSNKDFIMRIKISRKEAKETLYWLKLIDSHGNAEYDKIRIDLIREVTELMRIFGAILEKTKAKEIANSK